MKKTPRVLFLLKRREDYHSILHSNIGLSTGLYNSANFVHEMLLHANISSKLSVVTDNNCIDRAVAEYNPTHVIIEALWVVPSKFEILRKLHPNVIWIIRMHSETPFIAGEGMAMNWLAQYSDQENIVIACNAPRFLHEVRSFLQCRNNWSTLTTNSRVIYLPNYYPPVTKKKKFIKNKSTINIGCFGAIRPLKNHLVQALAAIEFAESINKKLVFHVNAGRIEMQGQPALNNLVGLFDQLKDTGHTLVNHQWCPRSDFLKICETMDIGMQISFSETFNIVGADVISQGVPLVGSHEIPWLSKISCADPTNGTDIFRALQLAYEHPYINLWINQHKLNRYTNKTIKIWTKYFN